MRTPSSVGTRPRVERGVALDAPRAAVETLAKHAKVGAIALGRVRSRAQREIHYDTPRGALAEHGVSLRVIEREGIVVQRVEERRELVAGFFVRAVHEAPLATAEPDLSRVGNGALTAQIRAACADVALVPMLELERHTALRSAALETARLTLRCHVAEARGDAASDSRGRIELASARGGLRVCFDAAHALLSELPELRPAREDDAARVARAVALEPAPSASTPLALPNRAGLAALVDAALVHCWRSLDRSAAAARAPGDAESVHQMRIAVRRFRTALRVLRDPISRERATRLRAALGTLAEQLGAVRDFDVFLARLATCEASRPPLEQLRRSAQRARSEAFAELAQLLDSPERAALDLELGQLAFAGSWRGAATVTLDGSATRAARAFVARANRRARRAGDGFAQLAPDDRHRLRLRVKSARYTAELLAPLLSAKRIRRTVRRARALQDALGVECDARRADAIMQQIAPPEARDEAQFVLGYGAGETHGVRESCERAWRRFRRVSRSWR